MFPRLLWIGSAVGLAAVGLAAVGLAAGGLADAAWAQDTPQAPPSPPPETPAPWVIPVPPDAPVDGTPPPVIDVLAIDAGTPAFLELPPLQVGPHVFHRRQLRNGLLALAVKDVGNDVSVFLVIAAGRRQETPATNGLAHLVEHAMYAGSTSIGPGEHDRRIAALGGESNAFTRDDYTLFYDHRLPAASLTDVLRLEAERLRGLRFDPAAFAHEQSRLADEEKRTFSPAAGRDELVEAAVFLAHPYGVGLLDADGHTLAPRLTLEQARDFYDQHYRPNRSAVVVAGNLDPAIALDAISTVFGPLAAGTPAPPIPQEPATQRSGRLHFDTNLERPLTEFVWVVPPATHPDRPALVLLARLLGHATLSDGRTVRASVGDRFDNEIFRLAAGGDQAETELQAVVERLRTDLVDAKELAAAKNLVRDDFISLALRGRPYFALAPLVGLYAVLGAPELPARWGEVIDLVDTEELRRVAQQYLAPERRLVVFFSAKPGAATPLPKDQEGLLRAAQEAEESLDLERAIDAYTALLQQNPSRMNRVIYLASRGQLAMRKDDFAAAIADFEEALSVVDYPAVRDLLEEARQRRLLVIEGD